MTISKDKLQEYINQQLQNINKEQASYPAPSVAITQFYVGARVKLSILGNLLKEGYFNEEEPAKDSKTQNLIKLTTKEKDRFTPEEENYKHWSAALDDLLYDR